VLTFAPDGKTLVCGNQDGVLHFWDATTGTELPDPSPSGSSVRPSLAFSPDGKTIALGDGLRLRLIGCRHGQRRGGRHGHHRESARRADAGTAAPPRPRGRNDRLWDAERAGTGSIDANSTTWSLMRPAPRGRMLLWMDREKTLRRWDITTRKEMERIRTTATRHWPLGSPRRQASRRSRRGQIDRPDRSGHGEETGPTRHHEEQVFRRGFSPSAIRYSSGSTTTLSPMGSQLEEGTRLSRSPNPSWLCGTSAAAKRWISLAQSASFVVCGAAVRRMADRIAYGSRRTTCAADSDRKVLRWDETT